MNAEEMLRILLVSEKAGKIQNLVELLESKHIVIFAENGKTALALAVSEQPDLILLDFLLPERDGLAVCTELKSNTETMEIPVIFISDRTEEDVQTKGLLLGAMDYIMAPGNAGIMMAKIENLLRINRSCQELKKHNKILQDSNRYFENEIKKYRQSDEQAKQNEIRLQRLVDILQHPSKTIQEFLDYALKQAIELTGSKIGYIYHYHEDKKEFVLNTWSEEVMAECAVEKQQTCYELDKTGIWGEAVRQRRPIVINDYKANHPLKKGYPQGHVNLSNFMTVPIFKNDKIVGVVGLANKAGDYNETDILNVSLLLEAVWSVTDRMKTEEALYESKARYEELVKRIPVGIYTIRMQKNGIMKFEYCSEKFCKMLGIKKQDMLGNIELVFASIHPADRPSLDEANRLAGLSLKPFRWEGRSLFYGETHWVRIESEPTVLPNGDSIWNGVIFDISEQKQAEEKLKESEERFKALHNASFGGIAIHDKGLILECNQGLSDISEYSIDELVGMDGLTLIAPDFRDVAMNNIVTGSEKPYEVIGLRKTSETYPLKLEARNIPYKGKIVRVVEFRDITERKQLEDELTELAIKDQLTGLYNRRKIDEVLMAESQQAERYDQDLAIIMADIDMFKLVNDQFGHLVGDRVLSAVAKILSSGIRKTDILGRWGGEEFMVICPDTNLEGATVLAEKLRKMVDTHEFECVGTKTCSFGVAQLRKEESIDALLFRSDMALYQAKERGRNRVETEVQKGET